MRQYLRKIPGGKLLKIKIGIEDGKISNIMILGDYFLYPEEKNQEIEKALVGKSKDDVLQTIRSVVEKEGIRLFGFSTEDLASLIMEAFSEWKQD